MIAAIDVQYTNDDAQAGLILFEKWQDNEPAATVVHNFPDCAPYVPGKFYQRELPVILSSLQRAEMPIELVVIDGYVDLFEGSPGLGRYLHNALDQERPVIGVAKSAFRDSQLAIEVFRGESKQPLLVTSAGIDAEQAAGFIKSMHGKFRIPTLLKLADSVARGTC